MTRKHMSAKFPSPVGELHFSMVARNSPSPNIQFPSPVGELHFSIWKWNHLYFCAGVSVPCRGTTFLNDTVWNLILKVSKCFRPLSGNYISQLLVFYQWYIKTSRGFRPLSGNYISQSVKRSLSDIEKIMFPSPVGELHFSIWKSWALKTIRKFPSPVGELHFSMYTHTTPEI